MNQLYPHKETAVIKYKETPSETDIEQAKEAIKESIIEAVVTEENSGLAAASELFEEAATNVKLAVLEGFNYEEDLLTQVVFWSAQGTFAAVEKSLGSYPANVNDPDEIYENNISKDGTINKRNYLGYKSREKLAKLSHQIVQQMEEPIEKVVAAGIVAAHTIELIESKGATNRSKKLELMPQTILEEIEEVAQEETTVGEDLAEVISIYRKNPDMHREIFRDALISLLDEDNIEILTQSVAQAA